MGSTRLLWTGAATRSHVSGEEHLLWHAAGQRADAGTALQAPLGSSPPSLLLPPRCPAVYVDGTATKTVRSRSATPDGWWTSAAGAPPQAPFDAPFALSLNLAVGGSWPGGRAGGLTPLLLAVVEVACAAACIGAPDVATAAAIQQPCACAACRPWRRAP